MSSPLPTSPDALPKHLLSLKNLEKAIPAGGGTLYLLRRITTDVAPGEFVTIMGPSGAGKCTLLGLLGVVQHAWGGEYWFLCQPVHNRKPKDRVALNKRWIGFVFQQYHLLDDLTVAENLDIPLSYRDVKRHEREAMVAPTLDRFNMVAH